MTAKFDKRMSRGLQILTSYTYGHALANTGTTLSGSPGFGFPSLRDYGSGYSSAAWDIRHNLTTAFTWDVPIGKGKAFLTNLPAAANYVLGNWQMNGLLTLRTGFPFTIRTAGCQGVWSACRPDLVPGRDPKNEPSGGRTPNRWFDTSAVQAPAPLTGGNLGLGTNNGPPTRTFDFSLFKDIPFKERYRLQFRAETFNLTNTPQFGFPNNNANQSAFGRITSTQSGSERKYQFSLRFQF
jgi:hypothetical protein